VYLELRGQEQRRRVARQSGFNKGYDVEAIDRPMNKWIAPESTFEAPDAPADMPADYPARKTAPDPGAEGPERQGDAPVRLAERDFHA
jgi:hypothetical protein